jgi:molybdopterin-guanine dinucleotide biosynthesis protein A
MSLLRNTPGSAANTQQMLETCARASLAATCFTLAVNAVLIKKSTVAELYKLAAQLAVVVDTDGHGQPLQHSKTVAQALAQGIAHYTYAGFRQLRPPLGW